MLLRERRNCARVVKVWVFGILRLVSRSREVVPDFAIPSCSSFETETFATDRVQSPSYGDEAVFLSLHGVSNVDTALTVAVTSQLSRSFLDLRMSLDARETFLE